MSASADMRAHRATFLGLAGSAMLVIGLVIGLQPQGGGGDPDDRGARAAATSTLPEVRHVFVINIENKGFHATWGRGSAAPYLAKTLRAKGALLWSTTGPRTQPGQLPRPDLRAGPELRDPARLPGLHAVQGDPSGAGPGQVVGDGCVPKKVHHCARPGGGGARMARLHARTCPGPVSTRWVPRALDDGDEAAAVRHPAQPVHVLPVDHLAAVVLQEPRGNLCRPWTPT